LILSAALTLGTVLVFLKFNPFADLLNALPPLELKLPLELDALTIFALLELLLDPTVILALLLFALLMLSAALPLGTAFVFLKLLPFADLLNAEVLPLLAQLVK